MAGEVVPKQVAGAMNAKGAADSVKADAMEAVGLGGKILGDIKSTAKVPVAGGIVFKAGFLICLVGVVGLFISTLVNQASKTWTAPVTFFEQEFVTELAYPDVYICLGGQFVNRYTFDKLTEGDEDKRDQVEPTFTTTVEGKEPIETRRSWMSIENFEHPAASFTSPSTEADASKISAGKCGDKWHAGPIKWNPESLAAAAEDPCPYVTPPTVGGESDDSSRTTKIFFGSKVDEASCKRINDPPTSDGGDAVEGRALTGADYKDSDNWVSSDDAEDVKTLAGLLPTTTVGTKEYKHVCVKYAAKPGAKQKHSDPEEHIMLKMKTMYMDDCAGSPDTTNLPHFSVILAEAGKKPYAKDKDGNNQIVASKGIFSGMGFYSLANLRVEKVNDQTKGSSFLSGNNPLEGAGGWVTNYELSMWNKLIPGGDDGKELALDTGFLGISFNDFLVRKITIRYKTFSEIIADIGGLWAAAFLLLGLLWKKSGYLSKPAGEEMWIFKYLPPKMRSEMLLGKSAAPPEEAEA